MTILVYQERNMYKTFAIWLTLLMAISASAQDVPSWSAKLQMDSINWAANGAEFALFADIPDGMSSDEFEHLYGIATGLRPSIAVLFVDWKPGASKVRDESYRFAKAEFSEVCRKRFRGRFEGKIPSAKCESDLLLILDKIYAGNFGDDLSNTWVSVRYFPPQFIPTDPFYPKPAPTVSTEPKCGSKLWDQCCPDGSYNTGICGPCQQKTKPASCNAPTGGGGDAGNCVKATLAGPVNIWEYTNTCSRTVIATITRWCIKSDAATAGQRRDITVVILGNETIKFDRRQFNGFCEAIAGNENREGPSSQHYQY